MATSKFGHLITCTDCKNTLICCDLGKCCKEIKVKPKLVKKFKKSDAANYDPGRHQQPTNGW